jgi:spermidine/putrescine transport system ATP-binding protein
MSDSIAVKLDQVTKRFGDFTAVSDVSLAIREGEFFSLLGPSGCGKTTTLRMIAGFELPSEGEIFLHGKPVGQLPPFKRNVNTVFQNYALFPHLTVEQNVAFGLEMKKVAKDEIQQRVKESLQMVRLPNIGRRKPNQLSGGQRQRVALARALINRPEVLLLDEPLGALDLKLRKAMQLELKELQQQLGITFIFVTHDQEEALVMSDRIGVLNEGLLLQVGTPREIYEQPANRFVADFIGETNFLNGRILHNQGGLATVTIAGSLTMQATCLDPVEPGQNVTLTIRPEKIHLHPTPNGVAPVPGETTFPGQIRHAVFLGTDTRFSVELADGAIVEVRHQNAQMGQESFAVGQPVTVSWPAHSAKILTS